MKGNNPIEVYAGDINQPGTAIIVTLETGKTLECKYLGYKTTRNSNGYITGQYLRVEEGGSPLDIPLGDIRVTHLKKRESIPLTIFDR